MRAKRLYSLVSRFLAGACLWLQGKAQAPRRDGNEISYADFSLLQSQVTAAVRDVQGARDAVSSIREQDLKL